MNICTDSMKLVSVIVTLFCLALGAPAVLHAQVPGGAQTGGAPSGNHGASEIGDTLFVFDPVQPLIDSSHASLYALNPFGVDILFSNSGFGFGGYYQWNFSNALSGFVDVGLTGSRNADEFDVLVLDSAASANSPYNIYNYAVPNKVNRLYTIPVTFGVRYKIGIESLADNFRPYVNAGVGPSVVLVLPYQYEFFTSISRLNAHLTGGGFVGFGAEVGSRTSPLGVNLRYYYIPMHPGLESLKDNPITDFGGLFLTINIGL